MGTDKVDKRLLGPVLAGFFIMGFCDMVAPITGRIAAELPPEQQQLVSFLPTMVFLWFLVLSLPKSIVFMAGGLVAGIFGGDLVVDNACVIAANFGVSQNFIGLTIIAIGTSLPELVTSIVATRKGDSGLALGNAIGSNIFNILFILGMSAAISPLNVLGESLTDCIILLISTVILFVLAKTKKTMSRWEGAVCVLLYIVYTAYLLIR